MLNDIMQHKGYGAQIMEAERLIGDQTFGLPPGSPLPVYPVDMFLKAPENWLKGSGSFVIPVKPNKGLWFNFRMNSEINTAVIMTVKGCNPITGLQTSGFHLEKYETKCPKHGCGFLAERFCPECNYKWPDRGYLSQSPLWFDGFRAEDGTVRQFFFTEDELRDVATYKIGKENTSQAFGFAFYSPKERRSESTDNFKMNPIFVNNHYHYNNWPCYYQNTPWWNDYNGIKYYYSNNSNSVLYTDSNSNSSSYANLGSSVKCASSSGEYKTSSKLDGKISCRSVNFASGDNISESQDYAHKEELKEIKDVSIGAGAKIDQGLPIDNTPLSDWKDTPDSVMTIYFVFQEQFEQIKFGGIRDLVGSTEGMLSGIPVG